jgi:hypothetical protein
LPRVRTGKGLLGILACVLLAASSARGDAPPPSILAIQPADVAIQDGASLSMVYQFYNPNTYPGNLWPINVTVPAIPVTPFYGPEGAAAGDFAELAAFPGYQATIQSGQYGQFTLNFTSTGFDDHDSASWSFLMPAASYSWTALGMTTPGTFGTPKVTLSDTPEPSAIALFGAALGCALPWAWWRGRRAAAR